MIDNSEFGPESGTRVSLCSMLWFVGAGIYNSLIYYDILILIQRRQTYTLHPYLKFFRAGKRYKRYREY